MCQLAGLDIDVSIPIVQMNLGRIHDVYRVGHSSKNFILQRLNPLVISNPESLVQLINHVLAPAGLSTELLVWPATGKCVLRTSSGAWVHRPFIEGESLTSELSVESFEAMAATLKHFHQSVSVREVEHVRFTGVDPWSGSAAVTIERYRHASNTLSAQEHQTIGQYLTLKKSLAKISTSVQQETPARETKHSVAPFKKGVVHRDTKPSNFILQPNNQLMLIDFDTIGIGDPALDLGELLRAWLSSDEADTDAGVSTSGRTSKDTIDLLDSQILSINFNDCAQAIFALHRGYSEHSMSPLRIKQAAQRCCLWQCERFLEDHFNGDTYYRVHRRGDNLARAEQQLKALLLLKNSI